ncbi:MAG TPA: fibronectin type III domain-containing protein [Actinomycetota bacterium]|nr:fibronectin type III domain-containing protein [Actinomycetota bacterium]
MRRLCIALGVVSLLTFLPAPAPAQELPLFTKVNGFATKTGFRGVFTWQASELVTGFVRYGTSPDALTQVAAALPGAADTAGMAIAQLDSPGSTYYFQVVDDTTQRASEINSFEAVNAYNDYDGSTYTIDLLVALDTQSLPKSIPADQALEDIAEGMDVFAERLYDAYDGHARLGNVLITDTNLDYAANVPFLPPVCLLEHSNVADVLVQTTVPFDSHTFGGWSIDDPCISFYVGRLGQLVVPWQDDLHFGHVAAHEMAHYAFNAPDLYPANSNADCVNKDWDGSLMHNTGGWTGTRWEMTELDRNPVQTPCDHGTQPYSWPAAQERYTAIPDGEIQHGDATKARGNADGGALDIQILNREPGKSSLVDFSVASPLDCTATGPQAADASGDATGVLVESTPGTSEPSLDILNAGFTWDRAAQAVTARFEVEDLTDAPPTGAIGSYYRVNFIYGGKAYTLVASRDPLAQSFRLLDTVANKTIASGLEGSFNSTTDQITMVLPASRLATADPAAPPLVEDASQIDLGQIIAQRYMGAPTITADIARGSCPYLLGQEIPDVVSTTLETWTTPVGRMRATGMAAKLTDSLTGAPVAGRMVEFRLDGVSIGQDATDESGLAEISHRGFVTRLVTESAGFAGDGSYTASSDTA